MASKPPTQETGHPGGYEPEHTRNGGTRYTVTSPTDWARELQFPNNIAIYEHMSRESHLSGIIEAVTEPVLTADWHLNTEGVPDNVVEFVRTELGLTSPDNPLQRMAHRGVIIHDHIEEMLHTMLWAGFSCAEIVYNPAPPTPAQEGLGAGINGTVNHLRKLASRHPRTITGIDVEADGGLRGIRQTPLTPTTTLDDKFIGVDNLVFYSYKRRGGDWSGESLLRPAYRPYILKDVYLRLDARAAEKHSSGVWHATSGDQNRANKLHRDLSAVQSGEQAVIVTDPGDTVNQMGVSGSLIDITPRLKFLNEEMSRSALAMFLDLGHDSGARSLGDTYVDVFNKKIEATARYIARIITEHIIRDLVRWNYPDGTPYPSLTPGDLRRPADATTLKTLLDSGAITTDPALEAFARSMNGIPTKPERDEEETTAPGIEELDRKLKEAQLRNLNTQSAGIAYRTGYESNSIGPAYDLPPELQHSGLYPVTVKTEGAVASEGDPTAALAAPTPGERTAIERATDAYRALMARTGAH